MGNCPVIFMPGYENINSGQERRGAYAIYTTSGCAGSKANGLADLSEKL